MAMKERQLSLRTSLEKLTDDGSTPLLAAAAEGPTEVVQELVRLGASVHTVKNDGQLSCFRRLKNVLVLRELFQLGAGVCEYIDHEWNATPVRRCGEGAWLRGS
jgi:hypothetical protein